MIEIRGTKYANHLEAARALDVSVSAIYNAERRGKLERVGLPVHLRKTGKGLQPLPVRVRGVIYESVRVAAKELDVTEEAIRFAIRRGTEDNVGLTKKARREKLQSEMDMLAALQAIDTELKSSDPKLEKIAEYVKKALKKVQTSFDGSEGGAKG